MAGVKRLLLVRKKDTRPNIIEASGLSTFHKTQPLPLMPMYSWPEEAGISHWGYILEGLMLEDLETLSKWNEMNPKYTLLPFDKVKDEDGRNREETIDEVLVKASLKVNTLQKNSDPAKTIKAK